MEATPARKASPAAEARLQDPTSSRSRKGKIKVSNDDWHILVLLVVAIFLPPLSVLCVTRLDEQFALNVLLELLTFGIGSLFHAIFVILYYGKGGHLSWGQRKKLARQRRAEALEFPANSQPPLVRNEAYADAPAYSAHGGGFGGDSKYL